MNRHRLVALRLASMTPRDRLWMMRRLPRLERPALREAMASLESAGILQGAQRLLPLLLPELSAEPDVASTVSVSEVPPAFCNAYAGMIRAWPEAVRQSAIRALPTSLAERVASTAEIKHEPSEGRSPRSLQSLAWLLSAQCDYLPSSS